MTDSAPSKPNELRLTDAEGNVLATLTVPFGEWALETIQRGERPLPFYGPAIVLRQKGQNW